MVEATPVVRLNLGVTDTATDKALQAVIVADVQHAVYHEGERAGGASRVIIGRAAYERISGHRSEEHTSELQSLMRISYAVFCLKKKKKTSADHEFNIRNTQV